ncbi:unnamed protein product [Spirodela intermedia]|uniref:Uncharacterized protein n=1 Tax=Spirodela intermedia TaxID=51605 RepID=A0A7I8J8E0_SPIIN|nr:unnamed protein product [Spirodela intermedia]CAA6666334.1 unnamed protein product [Spirodela intermedia]
MHVYLSVINKYTVIVFGFPAVLTGIQYATSAGAVWRPKKFLPRPSSSTSPIFIHTQLLLVIDADAAFRKQPFPSKLLFTSLVIILGGLIVYVATAPFFWSRPTRGRLRTSSHQRFVLYDNLLALMIAPLFCFVTSEYGGVFDPAAVWAVFMSRAFALSIRSASSVRDEEGDLGDGDHFDRRGEEAPHGGGQRGHLEQAGGPLRLACLPATIAGGVLYQQSVTRGHGRNKAAELVNGGDVEEGREPVKGAALVVPRSKGYGGERF